MHDLEVVWRFDILSTGIYSTPSSSLQRKRFCKCLWEEGHLPLIVLKQIVCKTSIYGRKMSFCLGTYWGKLPSIIITDDSIGDPHPVYIPNYGLCPVLIGIIGKNNSCVFHQWSWNVLHTWTTSKFFHSNLLLFRFVYNMFKTIWRENCSLKMLLILSCPISICQIDFFIFASKRIRLFLSSFHIVRYQCNDGRHTSSNQCVLFVCFQAYTYIYMIHFFQECITDINDCK